MIEFTKEKPFEFEGVKVWRKKNRPSVLAVRDGFECSPTFYMTSAVVHAITAMLDAERNTDWQWAPEPSNEARKGPWTVRRPDHEDAYYLFHEDLSPTKSHITAIFHDSLEPDENAARQAIDPGSVEAFKSFLAWRDQEAKIDDLTARVHDAMAKFNAAMQPVTLAPPKITGFVPKSINAVATVEVRLDLNGLADDLQAACDAVRAQLEAGLH